jgi:hypothetical protein
MFGLAAAGGHRSELLRLPAVLLAAAGPGDRKRTIKNCLRRLRGNGRYASQEVLLERWRSPAIGIGR